VYTNTQRQKKAFVVFIGVTARCQSQNFHNLMRLIN